MKNTLYLFLVIFLWSLHLGAQPDLSQRVCDGHFCLYLDKHRPDIGYYLPPGLRIAKRSDGYPDIQLLHTRFTGTSTYAEQGQRRFHSQLKIGLSLPDFSNKQRDSLIRVLQNKGYPFKILKVLPLQKIEARIVFAGLHSDHQKVQMKEAMVEASDHGAGIWKERVLSLRLSPEEAQLLEDGLRKNQVSLSIQYAYFTRNDLDEDKDLLSANLNEGSTGSEITDMDSSLRVWENQLTNELAEMAETHHHKLAMVHTDVLILPDQLFQVPFAIQRVDINDRLPPAFAALDIYCFDFHNQLRDDLYAKKIVVYAEGMDGNTVESSAIFRQKESDIYVASIHFPHAVKLNQALSHQVHEIRKDGRVVKSELVKKSTWGDIIDISGDFE